MILRAGGRAGPVVGLGVALAVAVSVLVSVAPASVAAAQSASDVEVRDQLIADQENLLNTYRCLFGVDVDVVPGGCPNPDTVTPGAAPPNPTQQDLDVRDGLIQSQEALLNVYRCQYDIDTQLVPGGCGLQVEATQGGFRYSAIVGGTCGLTLGGEAVCWGDRDDRDWLFSLVGGSICDDVCLGSRSLGIFPWGGAGRYHTCTLTGPGEALCWDYDDNEHTLRAADDPFLVPALPPVLPGGPFVSMVEGPCVLTAQGIVQCLGRTRQELDVPGGTIRTTGGPSWQEIDTLGGTFSSIIGDDLHRCALTERGDAVCWGESISYCQADAPEGPFSAIAGGCTSLCAVRADQTIACWGSNSHGQTDPPRGTFTAITTGSYHMCALSTSGEAVCWGGRGYDHGVSIDRGQADPPLGKFTAITAGSYHTCALTEQGRAVCWGDRGRAKARPPSGEYTAISAGLDHTCALTAGGEAVCWGDNDSGQADPPGGEYFGDPSRWRLEGYTCTYTSLGGEGHGRVSCSLQPPSS